MSCSNTQNSHIMHCCLLWTVVMIRFDGNFALLQESCMQRGVGPGGQVDDTAPFLARGNGKMSHMLYSYSDVKFKNGKNAANRELTAVDQAVDHKPCERVA